jgi:Fe-S oxidoreductase
MLATSTVIQWSIPERVLFIVIPLLGISCFAWIIVRRLIPLLESAPDLRFDRPLLRGQRVLQFWLAQWKQPRYAFAGILHIVIFFGFLALAVRSTTLVMIGIWPGFVMPGFSGAVGDFYNFVKDYVATFVFMAVAIAAIRRGAFKPARYAVPAKLGKDHTSEALFVLGLIATLMVSESLFEAASQLRQGAGTVPVLTLAWAFKMLLVSAPVAVLAKVQFAGYLVHELTFFSFLCFLPLGKHFHVVTSLFNVYFAKLDRGVLKPVRVGVSDEQLDQVKSIGVKTFTDFTWKHMLDFYSCADCGRCSDQCPANAVGRPLSPRFLTIKAREYNFKHYPLLGKSTNGTPLVGSFYSDDEIWSCTTCGACEQECPLLVEYIDKIVDLRRGLVDDGNVPKSLQKPLKALESRGNPYGKMDKKRGEWAKANGLAQSVKILDGKTQAETLYFVDSITSYDDRIQNIGRATAKILACAGENFGILGAAEKDSGHEARRFGEEMLYMALRDHNTAAIKESGVKRIVTADPHAFNALKHDYKDVPPVEHVTQFVAREVKTGNLKLNPVENKADVYTYHDPCYLGRHNQVYDDPRYVLDSIPGLSRVEMKKCRDRSFCCGGGGLMLFYEPQEEQRMGVLRVRMAAEAGANVMVTACPFCMVNMEDAIKVAGLEGKMTAIDFAELVERQLANGTTATPTRPEQDSLTTIQGD